MKITLDLPNGEKVELEVGSKHFYSGKVEGDGVVLDLASGSKMAVASLIGCDIGFSALEGQPGYNWINKLRDGDQLTFLSSEIGKYHKDMDSTINLSWKGVEFIKELCSSGESCLPDFFQGRDEIHKTIKAKGPVTTAADQLSEKPEEDRG